MEKQQQLRALGHELEVVPTSSGRRFIIRCRCGYGGFRSAHSQGSFGVSAVTRATFAEAIRTANWHADNVLSGGAQQDRQNGRVLPAHVAKVV